MINPPRKNSWRDQLIRWMLALAWTTNVAILVAAALWIFSDGRSLKSIGLLRQEISSLNFSLSHTPRATLHLPVTVSVAKAGVFLALGTLAVVFGGLFFGTQFFRGLRPWLLFVTLICAWLGLLTTWPELYWYGQQVRMRRHVQAYNAVARELQTDWPRQDGELPEMGPYLAYPIGAPTTLLLLGEGTIPETPIHIAAIERPSVEAMTFELAGAEIGAWLEWRADDTPPTAYVGGLDTENQVIRYARLAPNWYLVRYKTSAATHSS